MRALVPILVASHAALLLTSSRLHSPTRNEIAHVPTGLTCWEYGDFRLYCVNPPLAKMLATLPTLLLQPRTDGVGSSDAPGDRSEWQAAQVFANDNASIYFNLISSARL